LPDNNISIPVIGKLSPRQVHSFLGKSESIDLNNVAVITTKNSSSDSYDLLFDSADLVAISFPPLKQNLIEVEVTGEVRNPGIYLVSSSTNLDELYTLVGGLLDNSFEDGIELFRESVKEKQIKALRESKSILSDSMIQKTASVSDRGMVDIQAIIELADLIEPTGRVAGDFSVNSDIASNFILKDGDIINIPAISVEVTVQGEVLNSSSFIFNSAYGLQMII
jgi:SLBB domain.